MGDKKENSYSHILKYTGLFGSVQGLGILVGVLRNKFTALFLGPSGMGLLSLFSSTISVLSSACNFGIPTSGVKFISEKEHAADESQSEKRLISPGRFFLSAPIVCLLQFSEPSSVFFWVRYSMGLLFLGQSYATFHSPGTNHFLHDSGWRGNSHSESYRTVACVGDAGKSSGYSSAFGFGSGLLDIW